MMHDGIGFWGMGWIWWLLILIIILLVILFAVRRTGSNRSSTPGPGSTTQQKSAREILEERYARGEIDKREYEEKKKDLR